MGAVPMREGYARTQKHRTCIGALNEADVHQGEFTHCSEKLEYGENNMVNLNTQNQGTGSRDSSLVHIPKNLSLTKPPYFIDPTCI